MPEKEIIKGLRDLIEERKGFLDAYELNDKENVFVKDIKILENAIELIKSKQRIEFAKELDNATVLMISGKFTEGEQEKVLRFFNVSDFYEQLKVNEVGTDVQVNREIFFSDKHICELAFYHNESIDAVIHRLEELKKM